MTERDHERAAARFNVIAANQASAAGSTVAMDAIGLERRVLPRPTVMRIGFDPKPRGIARVTTHGQSHPNWYNLCLTCVSTVN